MATVHTTIVTFNRQERDQLKDAYHALLACYQDVHPAIEQGIHHGRTTHAHAHDCAACLQDLIERLQEDSNDTHVLLGLLVRDYIGDLVQAKAVFRTVFTSLLQA